MKSDALAVVQTSMPPFSTFCRDLFHDFKSARMKFPGVLLQEEGHRNTPDALTRQAPVGAVRDHRVEPVVAQGG